MRTPFIGSASTRTWWTSYYIILKRFSINCVALCGFLGHQKKSVALWYLFESVNPKNRALRFWFLLSGKLRFMIGCSTIGFTAIFSRTTEDDHYIRSVKWYHQRSNLSKRSHKHLTILQLTGEADSQPPMPYCHLNG